MTKARFMKYDTSLHVVLDGHQYGETAGKNIYCAAISAMISAFVTALKREDLMAKPDITIAQGYTAVSVLRTPRTEAFYDMLLSGCEAMAARHPDRVRVEK